MENFSALQTFLIIIPDNDHIFQQKKLRDTKKFIKHWKKSRTMEAASGWFPNENEVILPSPHEIMLKREALKKCNG